MLGQHVNAQNLNSGLLGRFPFDGITTYATGNMSTNSATNAGYGPDRRNQPNAALQLGGTGEVWILPNGLLSFGTTGDFSFSVAFRTLSSATQAFFSNQGYYSASGNTGTGARGWSLGFDNAQVGKVYFNLVAASSYNGNLGLATQSSFNDGQWHTATATVNRGTRQIVLYVDGVAQPLTYVSSRPDYGTISGTVFQLTTTSTMFVDLNPGYSPSRTGVLTDANRFGLNFNGSLDEARFYNRAVTAAEAQALHTLALAAVTARPAGAQVQVFPNPAPGGSLTVRLSPALSGAPLSVYTVLGQRVHPNVQPGAGSDVQLSGLAPGLYLLVVQGAATTLSQRFQVGG
ncbi:LamG-like jellyroll fold domain-containing protein [Hymenobacter sp. M29]|uniref:LamG-like jellyroll fold domain-containing protein n=1 Tax=Hymenobacter mellowenesis TaxID=3063995 RepID=A0ABT9AEQ0_9BACT|nr:LamG-like jellyroll fold domain-containing protein [Hymenobacter sp. M29]MDO7848323.1 LamG-like jellyroll fold domain-containing protein [Hymenobacter sp. M29]